MISVSPLMVVGARFNWLEILETSERPAGYVGDFDYPVVCRCVCCGTVKTFKWAAVRANRVKSCGCTSRAARAKSRIKHGNCDHPLYSRWSCMRDRCTNASSKAYHWYGGRGITVCDEWQDFSVFLEWSLANGYEDGLQLDRIDNNGPYSPDNCRFVTRTENMCNTRKNILITAYGETKCLKEWSRDSRCKVTYDALRYRVASGWELETVVTKPSRMRPKK